jgi:uncharacterized protein (TIGR00266 family)
MKSSIKDAPAFARVEFILEPGETLITEPDAMSSMDVGLELKAVFNGGFIKGLLRKFFGGESLFVSEFSNPTQNDLKIYISQPTPGDLREMELNESSFCLQPGAYLCSTPGIKLNLRWSGFASFIAREGLFKLVMSGSGKFWFGAYGALLEREVNGEIIVDTSHLVAFEPQLKQKIQMAGGWISSLTSGEGLVNRIEGKGKIIIQTRSMDGLSHWVNPRI